jgi:L-lysine 2,3-aminomutase
MVFHVQHRRKHVDALIAAGLAVLAYIGCSAISYRWGKHNERMAMNKHYNAVWRRKIDEADSYLEETLALTKKASEQWDICLATMKADVEDFAHAIREDEKRRGMIPQAIEFHELSKQVQDHYRERAQNVVNAVAVRYLNRTVGNDESTVA